MRRWGIVAIAAITVGLMGAAPAAAQTTITGGSDLLSQANANQLGAWLGEGPITINRIFTKASGMNSSHFHAAADGKGRTFSVIEVTGIEGTRIVGGYNPQSWDSHNHPHLTPSDADRTAFIFNLSLGFKQNQKKSTEPAGSVGQVQTLNNAADGPFFGAGPDLRVYGDLAEGFVYPYSYGPATDANGPNIYGTTNGQNLTVSRMEVFTVALTESTPAAVPEPSAALLFLPALGVVAFIRKRSGSK